MKVNKLIFFAHGWHLGVLGTPLFDENVEAWKWGTVIPSVYHKLKFFGGMRIPHNYSDGLPKLDINELDQNTKNVLEGVWAGYKNDDALYLSALTHAEGSPWYDTWNKGGKFKRHVVIPNERIETYYKQRVIK